MIGLGTATLRASAWARNGQAQFRGLPGARRGWQHASIVGATLPSPATVVCLTPPARAPHPPPQAKECMLFAGTAIANGSCSAVVTSIGMATEIGKIQAQIAEAAKEDDDTPLKKKLNEFGELLAKVGAGQLVVAEGGGDGARGRRSCRSTDLGTTVCSREGRRRSWAVRCGKEGVQGQGGTAPGAEATGHITCTAVRRV